MEIDTQTIDQEDDSLAAALSAAFDHIEDGGSAPDEPVLEIDQPSDALPEPQNIDGAAPAAEPVKAAADQAQAGQQPDQATGGGDSQKPATDRTAAAPSSWTRETAGKWAELPDDVRAEIHKRETDYHKGIEQYRQVAQEYQGVQQAIAPYLPNIQASGVHPLQAINHLLGVEHTLRNGSHEQKAQKLAEIARDYGIDLQGVAPLPQIDPHVQQLMHQNQQLQNFQHATIQQQQQAVVSEIDAFRENPENAHFEVVKGDMAALLNSGQAATLQDAYDKAVWMRPDIRQTLVQQQRTDAQKQAAEQKRRARAQSAAGGIRGAANPKAANLSPDASLRDTLSAAMDGNL